MGPLYTIGHSNLELGAFVALLHTHGVATLVDVRTYPGSRHCPWFNQEALAPALALEGIVYRHLPELGGRRKPNKQPPPEATWWQHPSFAAYAARALAEPAFTAGLDRLQAFDAPAIMCAEAQWWKCHRRIIADWLTARGYPVGHIMGPGSAIPHKLSTGAVVEDGRVRYPMEQMTCEC